MAVKKATKKAANTAPTESAPTDESTDTPPRQASKRGGARPGAGRPKKFDIAARTTESVEAISGALMLAGMTTDNPQLQYDARVIADRAQSIGAAMEQVASDVPAVRRALESLFKTSSWGKLVMTAAQVIVPVMACHGALPNSPFIVGPFVNESVGLPPEPPKRPMQSSPFGPTFTPMGDADGPIVGPDGTPIVLNGDQFGAYESQAGG